MNNNVLPVIDFEPVIIKKAKGIVLTSESGEEIIDYSSGQFCTVFGNSFNKILKFLRNKPLHTNTATLSSIYIDGIEQLKKILGNFHGKSILLNTGAEAIEFAIRYSKISKSRNGIICFDKGYHGLTLGAQSITYGGVFAKPIQPDIYSLTIPSIGASTQEIDLILKTLKKLCEEKSEQIACIVLEPIVSVGGMFTPDPIFFHGIRDICTKYDIILIFDECQTGFGRTGTWFNYEQIGVIPDIVVTAKAIGLGFPVSSVSITDSILYKYGMNMTHYSSHQNDPLAGAIIQYGVEYIERNNLLEYIKNIGEYFYKMLYQLSEETQLISHPRGKGLILGCDLQFEGVEDYRELSTLLRRSLLSDGALIQATNGGKTLRFLPAYIIKRKHIDFLFEKMLAALLRIKENGI